MTRPALIPRRCGGLALATFFLFIYSVAVAAPARSSTAPRAGEDGKLVPIQGKKIWDQSRVTDRAKTRTELTDLIRFKGNWYCSFREGEVHNNHPSGRVRIIRSSDGEKWDTVTLLTWDSGDVRETNLLIGNWILLIGNWIFRGIGSGRGLRGGFRLETESDPCSPPTLKSA